MRNPFDSYHKGWNGMEVVEGDATPPASDAWLSVYNEAKNKKPKDYATMGKVLSDNYNASQLARKYIQALVLAARYAGFDRKRLALKLHSMRVLRNCPVVPDDALAGGLFEFIQKNIADPLASVIPGGKALLDPVLKTGDAIEKELQGKKKPAPGKRLDSWSDEDLTRSYAEYQRWKGGQNPNPQGIGSKSWNDIQSNWSEIDKAISERKLNSQAQVAYDNWTPNRTLPDWQNEELTRAYAEYQRWKAGENPNPPGVGSKSWGDIQSKWGDIDKAIFERKLNAQAQQAYDRWTPLTQKLQVLSDAAKAGNPTAQVSVTAIKALAPLDGQTRELVVDTAREMLSKNLMPDASDGDIQEFARALSEQRASLASGKSFQWLRENALKIASELKRRNLPELRPDSPLPADAHRTVYPPPADWRGPAGWGNAPLRTPFLKRVKHTFVNW